MGEKHKNEEEGTEEGGKEYGVKTLGGGTPPNFKFKTISKNRHFQREQKRSNQHHNQRQQLTAHSVINTIHSHTSTLPNKNDYGNSNSISSGLHPKRNKKTKRIPGPPRPIRPAPNIQNRCHPPTQSIGLQSRNQPYQIFNGFFEKYSTTEGAC